MKAKSPLFRSIGVLLALLVFTALPSSTLAAGYCANVNIYYNYHSSGNLQVVMYSAPPSNPTIFYTKDGTNPTHDHATGAPDPGTYIYYGPEWVYPGQCITFKAQAHKPPYGDSAVITTLEVCNLPQ